MLRTPDDRFPSLPGYPFRRRYAEGEGGRTHYVDEGRGQVVVCLHGAPTWSYLYRSVIPNLAWKYRVIAPDLIGFGRSDKHAAPGACSLAAHVAQVAELARALDLRDLTLVGHGWGGLVAAALAAAEPARCFRLALVNPLAPDEAELAVPRAEGSAWALERSPGALMRASCPGLEPEAAAAYDAPFPDARFGAALGAMPLRPAAGLLEPNERERVREALASWFKPALVLCSDRDSADRARTSRVCALLPGAPTPVVVEGAGHFVVEERGEEVADRLQSFILRNPPPRAATTFQPVPFW
jgi:haloalkane dehalogenase